jgi:exonuclease III
MKLLSWNLNHRATRHRIPTWVAAAISEQAPDVLVLTEYVEGPNHIAFLASLNDIGLSAFSCSTQPGRENQVLIASRYTQHRCELIAPHIHPSVASK